MNAKHVTSLEISERLKELGVPQTSEFYWIKNGILITKESAIKLLASGDVKQVELYSAPLSSELGEMLPEEIETREGYLEWTTKIIGKHWCVWYGDKNIIHRAQDISEADARGKMLIHLIENGLIKAEELK
jgi:hypothetical protein